MSEIQTDDLKDLHMKVLQLSKTATSLHYFNKEQLQEIKDLQDKIEQSKSITNLMVIFVTQAWSWLVWTLYLPLEIVQ